MAVTNEAGGEHDTTIIKQHETRCLVLGVDGEGLTHVFDERRRLVVVISRHGIDQQQYIEEGGLGDWMRFVAAKRGWWKEQWDGYQLSEAVFGGDSA